jgi:hypothetical protein
MPKKTTKKDKKQITETEDSWIGTNEKAVFINITEQDFEKMPVLEDDKGKRKIVLVTSVQSVEKLLNGDIKGVKLGYFNK